MSYNTLPFQVSGRSAPSRSRPLSSQESINIFPQLDPQGKDQVTMQSMAGVTLVSNIAGVARGQHVMAGIRYRVVGDRLYRVEEDDSHTSLGVIAGSERCCFANNGVQLIIVVSGLVYSFTESGGLSEVTDADIVGSICVDIINNQFIYTKPDLFVISDVNDGTNAFGLNAAQAESQPDSLVRAYVFLETILMFGENSLEGWFNNGVGNPPVQRIQNQVFNIGLGALHGVVETDQRLYYISDDLFIYRSTGVTGERVSDITIANEFESYDRVDDCVAWTFIFQGQNFIVFDFPSAGKTWCLNETLGIDGWFRLESGVNGEEFNYSSAIFWRGDYYLEGKDGGLYIFDINKYDHAGTTIRRSRTTASIDSEILGAKHKEMRIGRLELELETGVGLITGQGEDPQIMVEASYDGGRSWHHLPWMNIGILGEYARRVRCDFIATCFDCMFRLTVTDPVPVSIYSATVDIKLTGR